MRLSRFTETCSAADLLPKLSKGGTVAGEGTTGVALRAYSLEVGALSSIA
jgi:hypothetical protein